MAERIQQPRSADGSGSEINTEASTRGTPEQGKDMSERQRKSKDAAMKRIKENIEKYNPLIGD